MARHPCLLVWGVWPFQYRSKKFRSKFDIVQIVFCESVLTQKSVDCEIYFVDIVYI